MPDYQPESIRGTLSFTVYVSLKGAEARNHPWSHERTGKRYLPYLLKFELRSDMAGLSQGPRYDDLEATYAHLFGHVLKQDGTPGKQEIMERLYRQSDWPDWVHEIIEAEIAKIKALDTTITYKQAD